MIVHDLAVEPAAFAARTGWEARPEGLCKGQICVPGSDVHTVDGLLDLRRVAERLSMPVVSDEAGGVHAIGPEAMGHALTTAAAPHLELPDADGNAFDLSALEGRKVLLVAWASW